MIDHLEQLGVLDDTIVMLFSDNSASAERGGFPVDDSYEPPFEFTGTLAQIRVEVAALAPADPGEEVALALQHE